MQGKGSGAVEPCACATGGSVVASRLDGRRSGGAVAGWRASIDLPPLSCQAIDFRPAGPTILMVTAIGAVQSNKVCPRRAAGGRAGDFCGGQ